MDDLLWPRVLAAFAVDLSLAVLAGLLLSGLWLQNTQAEGLSRKPYAARTFAALLLAALACQLALLTISFSGQPTLHTAMAAMPDVCATHAGSITLASGAVALLLLAATWLPTWGSRTATSGVLLASALTLHAATGHAAADGSFSRAELLQAIHLSAMAAWSGGVIVSGLAILPRLRLHAAEAPARTYLSRLSRASTWALAAVLLTGVVKAYLATGGSLLVIRSSPWGLVLIAKSALVTLTVLLGARNRFLLRGKGKLPLQTIAPTLRLEAILMLTVLLVSAWLANTSPPLE